MVAAGYDLPYIQAQVGHRDPSTPLAIYAQVIARPDRDELHAEIRQLLGTDATRPAAPARPVGEARPHQLDVSLKLPLKRPERAARSSLVVPPVPNPNHLLCRELLSGETRTRTGDTTIFSRVLYQLSYLASAGDASA